MNRRREWFGNKGYGTLITVRFILVMLLAGSASCARDRHQERVHLLETTFESPGHIHKALGAPSQQFQQGGHLYETYHVHGEVVEVHYHRPVE